MSKQLMKRVEVTGQKVQWRDEAGKLHVHGNGERVLMPSHVAEKEWRNVKEIPPVVNQDYSRRNTSVPKGGAQTRKG